MEFAASKQKQRMKKRMKMKTKILVHSLGALLIVATLAGCNKKSDSSSSETPHAPDAPATAQPAAPAAGQSAKAATNAAPAMTEAIRAAQIKVDGMIAQAKSFIADKRYDAALEALNQLSGMALTPEQQKTVDDLKAQVKKLTAGDADAANAAKNLIGK